MASIIDPDAIGVSSVFDCPSNRSALMRRKVRKKILEMTKQHHTIRKIYKDTLRALINVMWAVEYIDAEN